MEDELAIVSSLDQPLVVEYDDVLEAAEEKVNQAIKDKDFEEAMAVCFDFIASIKVSGRVLARLFVLLHSSWDEFEIEDNFYDAVSSYLGLHRQTVVTYERVYNMSPLIPEEYQGEFEQKPINALVPIANAIEQGYEISDDEWKELAGAPDYATVGKLVREKIKGAEPRKYGLSLSLDRDGSLWAWKDNERKFIGSLEINDEDEIVQRACNRIISNSGIMRK